MTSALTPELALAYLRELSGDIDAAVLLDAAGAVLAGDEPLGPAARELLAASEAASLEVLTPGGDVFAARSERFALVVAARRVSLPGLVRHDLELVLGDLEGTP
jgi:hypothetical protein